MRVSLPGRVDSDASPSSAVRKIALPGYFETLGIPIRRGRGIEARDGPGTRPVVVVNEEMARRYFDGVDPVGRSFSVQEPGAAPLEIVGVVGNVMTAGTRPEPQPAFYLPHAQVPIPILSMVMRVAEGDPLRLARDAERTAWSTARSANVYAIETLEQRIGDQNWRSRFGALLLGGFAGLALLLGAAGIYAVISCSVAQRRPEIGVRLALGAAPWSVLGMVVGDALRLAAAGVALGGMAALALGRLLAGLLYGVSAGDPPTLALVALGLLAVAVAASLLPALRAMRTDPVAALRE